MTDDILSLDLVELARNLWKHRGILLSDLLARLTPSQFVAQLMAPDGGKRQGFDRVRAIQLHNDERGRRGLPPVVPSWM